MDSPGEGAGAAPMAPSVSVIVISGEEGSVRVVAVAIAMPGVAPIGWADPRGHVERKKANSARRSETWATNTSIPTYGRSCTVIPPDSHQVSWRVADYVHVWARSRRDRRGGMCGIKEEGRAITIVVVVVDVQEVRTPGLLGS